MSLPQVDGADELVQFGVQAMGKLWRVESGPWSHFPEWRKRQVNCEESRNDDRRVCLPILQDALEIAPKTFRWTYAAITEKGTSSGRDGVARRWGGRRQKKKKSKSNWVVSEGSRGRENFSWEKQLNKFSISQHDFLKANLPSSHPPLS